MKRFCTMFAAAALLAGCGRELPTEVGGGLFPTDVIRSFEVVLPASQFLVSDTSFGFYSEAQDEDFGILANRWDGALDSRVLVRYNLPTTISVLDSNGVIRTDSLPSFFSADIVVVIDSLRSSPRPMRLGAYRSTEFWHASATWTARVDTPGVQLPWATAGGSPGQQISTNTWNTATDTILLPVDSATLASWRDTANVGRGAVLV